jgi:hypothetical protein
MKAKLREEIDGDILENYVGITDFKTDENQHEITCGMCNKTFYADRETSEGIYRKLEEGLENPFVCNDCQREYEESAYENR